MTPLSSASPPLSCTISSVNLPKPFFASEVDATTSKTATENGVETMEATLFLNIRCDLGECILYDDEKNQLCWTDINDEKFYALSLPAFSSDKTKEDDGCSGRLFQVSLPKMLGAFALPPRGKDGYLCAFEDGFQLCSLLPPSPPLATSSSTTTVEVKDWVKSAPSMGEAVNPLDQPTRLNDGRCDPTGLRFICGGYYGGTPSVFMKVYKCEVTTSSSNAETNISLQHQPIYENIQVTNSICFRGTDTMFLADSPQQTIYKLPYDSEHGKVDSAQKKILFQTTKIPGSDSNDKDACGVPDGSCVDREGYVWNAVWRSGAGPSSVNRIHPETGAIVFRVLIPTQHRTSQLTCCCFGGPNLDILFISSAAEHRDLEKEPYAGSIYAAKVPFQGKPEVRFTY